MPESLFPPPDVSNKYEYRAVGVVRGRYYPSSQDFNLGSLATSCGVIQAAIFSRPNSSLMITPQMIENELLFSVYPQTTKDQGNIVTLKLVRVRKDTLDIDSYFSIRGNLVSVVNESLLVKIHRNARKFNFFYLAIKGTLPEDGLDKFWDLECVLSGQVLQLVKAQLVGKYPSPLQQLTLNFPQLSDTQVIDKRETDIGEGETDEQVPHDSTVILHAPVSPFPFDKLQFQSPEQPNTTVHNLVTVKSEITLKFDALPAAEPAPNKKVKLDLTDEHENRFIILLNSKSYKKATEQAASYPKYAGNISGKLGKLTADGFEVLDAGIKIFEIKSQPQAQEEESA